MGVCRWYVGGMLVCAVARWSLRPFWTKTTGFSPDRSAGHAVLTATLTVQPEVKRHLCYVTVVINRADLWPLGFACKSWAVTQDEVALYRHERNVIRTWHERGNLVSACEQACLYVGMCSLVLQTLDKVAQFCSYCLLLAPLHSMSPERKTSASLIPSEHTGKKQRI